MPSVLISSHHVVVGVLIQKGDHVPYDLRPLLQIRVDQTDIVSACMLESCIERRFLTEIPREGYYLYRAFPIGIDFSQLVQRGILTAVVYKDDLIGIAAALKRLDGLLLEKRHILRLVVARDDQ